MSLLDETHWHPETDNADDLACALRRAFLVTTGRYFNAPEWTSAPLEERDAWLEIAGAIASRLAADHAKSVLVEDRHEARVEALREAMRIAVESLADSAVKRATIRRDLKDALDRDENREDD